jgi:iron-sulfur cluster insertion protein
MLTLTANAHKQIDHLLKEEQMKYVRAFVEGGGCSGFNYGFTMEDEKNEDDYIVDNLIVDAMSMQYFVGATIDYKKSKMGEQFVIDNPNAKQTCGCGSSFTV